MQNDRLIDCWIFDLGGVLINLDSERCKESFRNLGLRCDADIFQDKTLRKLSDDFATGKVSGHEFYENLLPFFAEKVTENQVKEAWNSMLLDIPETKLDKLFMLKRKYKVFMLSNTNEWHWQYILDNCIECDGMRLDDYFHEVFLSFEMGLCKPDKKIYEEVIKRTGITPSRALFIDDLPENVEAAKQTGLMTYLEEKEERSWVNYLFPNTENLKGKSGGISL